MIRATCRYRSAANRLPAPLLGIGVAVMAFLWLGGSSAGVAPVGVIGTIDLMTTKGVEAVHGQWRYHEVLTGTGPKKNEIEPKAHGQFDDSTWEVIAPETLGKARGPGKYSWCWYRIKITIPEIVNGKQVDGPVWFQTTVDDYGEIWVDGRIDSAFGKTGRGAVSGFNTPNRVRLEKSITVRAPKTGKKVTARRDARPGDQFQIAVLGINGPLGKPPDNFIFLRAPTVLEFFARTAPHAGANIQALASPPAGKVVATLNLLDKKDVDMIQGKWRRHIVSVHTGPKKNEIEPQAHGVFDDSSWEVLRDPALLAKPYGPGKFSMAWYRIKVTIPEKVGNTQTAGTAVWFRTTVDDYGEIWVNGNIDSSFGKSGRGAICGFNRQNEVLLTANAKPGQRIQIAVLAINGPFGQPPGNYIFFRKPTEIRFFKKP